MSAEEKLARKMRSLRRRYGWTQEKLAEKAALEYKYIQMLEGKKPPSATLRTLQKLARALNIEPWQLIK